MPLLCCHEYTSLAGCTVWIWWYLTFHKYWSFVQLCWNFWRHYNFNHLVFLSQKLTEIGIGDRNRIASDVSLLLLQHRKVKQSTTFCIEYIKWVYNSSCAYGSIWACSGLDFALRDRWRHELWSYKFSCKHTWVFVCLLFDLLAIRIN